MTEIFREPPKLLTDVHFGIRFLSDTLCRRGGIWEVSQIIQTLIAQNQTKLTQNNIPKLLKLKRHFYL